ncbi:YihY/virulence factor BrkB family protein [Paracoccus sp. TK19116]|uniref:YihY/virulence factor BrkB family protein n=1 Tax=Paracoccus albicereus TaxID=2922394 RepID=A0ABT1MTN6_9RHOB|nr:YihY/virulence factor BrkB family protein [Paracoccus albicereus]MCQ0971682.1 YihY/virulence factor BrkB family protein [Paracoccus albicereus]
MSETAANRSTGLYEALFAPLDEDTRRAWRIGPDARAENEDIARLKQAADEAARRAAEAEQRAVLPKSDLVRNDAPTSPWVMTKDDWLSVGKSTLAETSEDRVTSVAGGVVFFSLLALFPALTALVSIYGLVADRGMILEHLSMMQAFLPSGAYGIIEGQIQSITSAPSSALSAAGLIAIAIALYSATGGTRAMIDALNIAFFTVETRSFIKKNLIAIGFTLGGIILLITMLGVIAVIPAVLRMLPLTSATEWMVAILRWPIMFAVVVVTLAALYRWGPAREPGKGVWRGVLPGALFAAAGLVVASMLFSWYAANFANYNETYGSLGAAVGLMMWLWIASIVVMVGAELNSEIERHLRKRHGLPDLSDLDKATPPA